MALYVVLNVNASAMLSEGNLNKKCREIIYDEEHLWMMVSEWREKKERKKLKIKWYEDYIVRAGVRCKE
jgi:hypothetical protein